MQIRRADRASSSGSSRLASAPETMYAYVIIWKRLWRETSLDGRDWARGEGMG